MARKAVKYDRTAEDLGNIVGLEHLNLLVPDQRLAMIFYIGGLGLTRDPYMQTGPGNMWINIGDNQFHLPTRGTQVMRGTVGLVLPDLKNLVERLKSVKKDLTGTKFGFKATKGARCVEVTCPWGNRIRCHAAGKSTAPIVLGMSYAQFDVPVGVAEGIAKFYREIMGANVKMGRWESATAARVSAGYRQELIFSETRKKIAEFDGHHIQIYLANFSGPYKNLLERSLITQESNQHQYRFIDIVDPKDGKLLFNLDHEVRSMTHPMYGRSKLNRNPDQSNELFARGHETQAWLASATGS
ncbi:MAG: hypothetical protein CMM52_13065 [Rhodospirillaceae bacterium]|nr:hypothetical protein [Rhodospirillaceae bacterium]|tara:strand:+ start:43617 stop:44513 length:897 start_codon:yes stop_codon:yes gene_type:complete